MSLTAVRFRPYSELNLLSPEAFLRPEDFRTGYDSDSLASAKYAEEQYQTGLGYSKRSRRVFICANGTWGADLDNGGIMTSYEGIGYHAGTAALLRGILAGPAPVVVYRWWKEGPPTEIKPRTA